MKEQFRNKRFNKYIKIKLSDQKTYWEKNTFEFIKDIIYITDIYLEKDIKMTLRQLYYQLVSHDIIPNDNNIYKKLSKFLTNLRYNGIIDWDVIEDRVRVPKFPGEWKNIPDLIDSAIYTFRLPRWENQKYYIELATEKDALSSILYPIADKWHIPFSVNRGYTSATAMYDLFKRVFKKINKDKKIIILYLGDHDPSGIDMCRDIEERLKEFLITKNVTAPFNILKIINCEYIKQIGLTTEQVKKYNPPPNPAKITDPRAKFYIEKYGNQNWEVDALPPDIMIELVESSIKEYIDLNEWDEIIEKENKQKNKLEELMDNTEWK